MVQCKLNRQYIKNRYVIDIETMTTFNDNIFGFNLVKMGLGVKELILIGLYDGKNYRQFNNFKDCIDFILKESEIAFVYAHNGGRYDYLYLLEEATKDIDTYKEYKINHIISLGSNIIFDINKNNRKIKFHDSYKILPDSLEKLCNSYQPNIKKIKMNYNALYSIGEIEEYLKADCISLFDILNIFEKEIKDIIKDDSFNLDKYISLASMSFDILNKKYLKGITKNRMSKEKEDWCRQAYYGGRTEVFRFEGKNLNYFDVNSLYPFVMKDNYFPIGYGKHFKNSDKIKKLLFHGLFGIIKCKVNYPKSYICCLPFRVEKKLMFPYGYFEGVYTNIEILQAINEGAIIEYKEAYFWVKKEKIFEKFVADFYHLKENSKGAKRDISKRILNSSYGKFGQKRKYSEIVTKKDYLKLKVDIEKNNLVDMYEELGEGLFYSKDKTSYRNRKINPIYAIFVTSYARLYLFNLMKLIGYNNLYYCDTDSIICSGTFPENIIHETSIGKLKKEVDIIRQGYFISPKFYALDYIKNGKRKISIKIKGVDRELLKSLSIEQFRKIVNEKKYEFTIKRMISFNQKYTRLKFKDCKGFVNLDEIHKELSCKYDKRITNGNDTEPLFINNILSDIDYGKTDNSVCLGINKPISR